MSQFDPYNHFGFLTHRVARLMDQVMGPRLKEKGLHFPISCIGILANLWQKDGVTQKELGTSLVKTKSSITKMLEALEQSDMIEKRNDPTDKRNKLIFLTEKGIAFRKMMEEKRPKSEKELIPGHSKEEIEIAKSVLKTLYINLKDTITKETA